VLTPQGLVVGSRGPYSLNKPLLVSFLLAWSLYFLHLLPIGIALAPFVFVFALCTYLVFQRGKARMWLLGIDSLCAAVCVLVWRTGGLGLYIPTRNTSLALLAVGAAGLLMRSPWLPLRRLE
jgi:hypothetical protein